MPGGKQTEPPALLNRTTSAVFCSREVRMLTVFRRANRPPKSNRRSLKAPALCAGLLVFLLAGPGMPGKGLAFESTPLNDTSGAAPMDPWTTVGPPPPPLPGWEPGSLLTKPEWERYGRRPSAFAVTGTQGYDPAAAPIRINAAPSRSRSRSSGTSSSMTAPSSPGAAIPAKPGTQPGTVSQSSRPGIAAAANLAASTTGGGRQTGVPPTATGQTPAGQTPTGQTAARQSATMQTAPGQTSPAARSGSSPYGGAAQEVGTLRGGADNVAGTTSPAGANTLSGTMTSPSPAPRPAATGTYATSPQPATPIGGRGGATVTLPDNNGRGALAIPPAN